MLVVEYAASLQSAVVERIRLRSLLPDAVAVYVVPIAVDHPSASLSTTQSIDVFAVLSNVTFAFVLPIATDPVLDVSRDATERVVSLADPAVIVSVCVPTESLYALDVLPSVLPQVYCSVVSNVSEQPAAMVYEHVETLRPFAPIVGKLQAAFTEDATKNEPEIMNRIKRAMCKRCFRFMLWFSKHHIYNSLCAVSPK